MRRVTRLLVVVALVVWACGCAPRNITPECTDMINHCLQDCPPTDDHMGIGGAGLIGIGDRRSKCERRCKHVCDDPADEAPAKPEDEGIPTL
jgi:hypothetical protein